MAKGAFAAFAASVAFYHVSEFALSYVYNRSSTGWHSWLVTKPYCAAMTCACIEHAVECWLLPGMKGIKVLAWAGGAMVVAGEGLRKSSMVTARHNFTHTIQHERRREHRLVTHGVYRFARHPGYLGWLMWSVGTQVMLGNPVCTCGFAVAGWRFFADRIPYEEALLRRFFGREYDEFAARTPTRIPFIR